MDLSINIEVGCKYKLTTNYFTLRISIIFKMNYNLFTINYFTLSISIIFEIKYDLFITNYFTLSIIFKINYNFYSKRSINLLIN